MDINTFKAQFKEQAEERVRVQLTLEKLGEVENITASKEEVDAKIEEMAKNYGEKSDMFRNSLRPEDMQYFEEEIKVKKIAEFVVANAKVKEEVCDCDHDHDHEEKPDKKTTKKTTKKAESEEVASEVAAEAPKKRGRKPKAEAAE